MLRSFVRSFLLKLDGEGKRRTLQLWTCPPLHPEDVHNVKLLLLRWLLLNKKKFAFLV